MIIASAANLEPWFPAHTPRDIYLSLLHLDEKVPDSILKAALLQRACEDIRRILAIRNQKGPLNALLQRGSVGDDLWQRFTRAEKEIEAELRDVVEEVSELYFIISRLQTFLSRVFLTILLGQCTVNQLGANYLPERK